MRRIVIGFASLVLSAVLILSIPLLNLLVNGGGNKKDEKKTTAVVVKKIDLEKKEPPKKKPSRRPKRSQSKQRNVKAGPRFAMDLGVAGMGGVQLPSEMVNQSRGQGGGAQGDVDERPEMNGSFAFSLPQAIKDAEINAFLTLSFCVDPTGGVYDIRVVEEKPAGMGLAEAGKQALQSSRFSSAVKDGKPVAFCGMEQPVEVRFKD